VFILIFALFAYSSVFSNFILVAIFIFSFTMYLQNNVYVTSELLQADFLKLTCPTFFCPRLYVLEDDYKSSKFAMQPTIHVSIVSLVFILLIIPHNVFDPLRAS
jgi:uncharacterized protein with PQ loop repeat